MMRERFYKAKSGWEVRVTVIEEEKYSSHPDLFSGKLSDVIAAYQRVLDSIPEEYRAEARCDIDSVGSYEDSHYATVEIVYTRPATPKEVEKQELLLAASQRAEEDRERAVLARLTEKYGAP